MDYLRKKDQLLDELKRTTGLELSVPESALTDKNIEKTLESLRLLCDACRMNGSRETVLRRWMTGECSEGDFLASAASLHIDAGQPRSLCYIELDGSIDDPVMSTIKHVLADRPHSVIIRISDSALAVLDYYSARSRSSENESRSLYDTAENILTLLNTELYVNARAACSSVIPHLQQLPEAFSEAVYALKVGMIFQPDRNVYSYEDMGESRLLYELGPDACSEYISETLGSDFNPSESHIFDGDILYTAECFLKNDLNIAETARLLHIHRNTLLYRLDLIQKETGLDIRRFRDAMRYYLSSLIITRKNTWQK